MSTHNRAKGTILIVDDNPVNLDILFHYLDEAGFEVFVAEDGESALEQAKYTAPDIILLDVMMPGIDGFETCRHFKANPKTKEIPIIFITALTNNTDKVMGFEAGAVDYITKPLHHEEVLARVTTHLTIRNLQRSLHEQNAELQQEIDQRCQAEEKLHQQTQKLQEQNNELDAFSRIVAHDLTTPLNVIIGYTEIIRENAVLAPDLELHLQTIIQTSYHMHNIIDSLLLLAHLRNADVVLEPLNMATIINVCQDRLAHMIDEYQAEIIVPSTWPVGLGYATWVEQIWVNYLSNAIKYGGQPPRVELGATPTANHQIRFWVRDNGAGLTAEDQAQLFTEFTRLDRDRVKGHGLGLSIVKRIVKKLDGEVGVEGQRGQGSTFYFTLQQAADSVQSYKPIT